MTKTLQIGNSTIVLTDHIDDFHDGYSNGYLYYYDERHHPLFSLTSDSITTFIETNMTDPPQVAKLECWFHHRMDGSLV